MSNPLLPHMALMQARVAAYLEPTPSYTNLMGAECPHGQGTEISKDQFIGDIIHLLDGPEQREAQKLAEFDYLAESERTASGHYHGVLANRSKLLGKLATFAEAAEGVDHYKKLLFYGEDFNKKRFADQIAEPGATATEIVPLLAENSLGALNHPDIEAIIHAVLGIASEAGEIVEALLNAVRDKAHPLDLTNLVEETGDLLWYQAMLLRVIGVDFDDVMHRNIDKLKERFPKKFETELANNRNLDAERKALEGVKEPTRKFFEGDTEDGVNEMLSKG